MESLLTIPEVAKLLNVGKTTVYRLIESGELKSKVIGRNRIRKTVRIKKEWVADYVNSDVPTIKQVKRSTCKNLVERY